MLKISLNPGLNLTIFLGTEPKTAGRRGRQNAWVWQTWRGLYLPVLSGIQLTLMFFALLQKDLFKGMWSFAEGYFKQNYCHACHSRFAVVFPHPSFCVSSLILKTRKKIKLDTGHVFVEMGRDYKKKHPSFAPCLAMQPWRFIFELYFRFLILAWVRHSWISYDSWAKKRHRWSILPARDHKDALIETVIL